jgi:hypothetical protein
MDGPIPIAFHERGRRCGHRRHVPPHNPFAVSTHLPIGRKPCSDAKSRICQRSSVEHDVFAIGSADLAFELDSNPDSNESQFWTRAQRKMANNRQVFRSSDVDDKELGCLLNRQQLPGASRPYTLQGAEKRFTADRWNTGYLTRDARKTNGVSKLSPVCPIFWSKGNHQRHHARNDREDGCKHGHIGYVGHRVCSAIGLCKGKMMSSVER